VSSAGLTSGLALPASRSSRTAWLILIALASLVGAGAFALGEMETRWLIYALAALGGTLILLLTPQKDRLLSGVFVLGLQADVYLRLSYGRAGSTEGIAISLVTVAGAAWLFYRYFALGPGSLKSMRLNGIARLPLLGLIVCTIASIATSTERFIGVGQLVFELQMLFIYWLAFNAIRDVRDFRRIVTLLMAILIIQSVVLYIENALGVNFSMVGEVHQRGEVPRPGGTVSTNPAGYASFITPALLLAFAYMFSRNSRWRPAFAVVAAALGAIAIGLTFTRAAWAGTAMALAMLCFLLARRRLARWNRILAVGVLVAGLGMALLPTMTQRLSHDYGANATKSAWDERWGLMRIAFNMIAHHPVTGVGPAAYMYTYKDYIPPGLRQWTSAVHNEFLLRAAEIGIPGAIAFTWLIFAGFRIGARLLRSRSPDMATAGAAWLAAMVSLTWQMSWVPWTGFTYNAMLWFMLGVMDAACRVDREQEAAAKRDAQAQAQGQPAMAMASR
jgi:O-antigen ligase